jgi:hypothetical protein
MTVGAELDAGSFRDPDSRVFFSGGAVLRALSERGVRDWRALVVSRLFAEVAWLAELGAPVVVELVCREDAMVRRLLAAKPEGADPDYEEAFIERVLGEAFEVARREVLRSGTRVLYHALPR